MKGGNVKVLILSLTCLFAVDGMALAQTPTATVSATTVSMVQTPYLEPDFSYLWVKPPIKDVKSFFLQFLPPDNEDLLISGLDVCRPYSIPAEVQKGFEPVLKFEWKFASNWGKPELRLGLKDLLFEFKEGFRVYRINHSKIGKNDDLYVLQMTHLFGPPISSNFYFLVYDTKTKTVNNKDVVRLGGDSLEFGGTKDILGDGSQVIEFAQSSHNGTEHDEDVYFFSVQSDLCLKRSVYLHHDSSKNGQADDFGEKFNSKDPKWQKRIKEFNATQNIRFGN